MVEAEMQVKQLKRVIKKGRSLGLAACWRRQRRQEWWE
jgi:hypothetical protein